MSSPEPPRTARIALWRAADDLIRTIFNLFGAPEQIAADHTLTAKTYRLLLSWLRTGEAMVRHLLLIEAAALTNVPPASSRHSPKHKREPKLMFFEADKPESWRVSFRCLGSTTNKPRGLSPSKAGPTRNLFSAWPLAERAEAMLRAYNNPGPYAQRLARRLRANPRRTSELLVAPDTLTHRIGDDVFADLRAACESAKPVFNNPG